MVLREVLEYGKKIGHEIRIHTLYPENNDLSKHPDLTILADIFNVPDLKKKYAETYIYNITNNRKFIHFDNSYVDLCDKPYLPCDGNSSNLCPFVISKYFAYNKIQLKKILRHFRVGLFCTARRSVLRGRLYLKSLLNIFVSPLHEGIIYNLLKRNREIKRYKFEKNNRKFKTTFFSKSYILKPLIDPNYFYKPDKSEITNKKYKYLCVGAIGEAKGYDNYKKLKFREDITFVGTFLHGKEIGFGNFLGYIPYKKIPELMRESKNFIFLPRWPEPQGRVVIEAALSGCNIIGNENVGALSFPFDLKDPNNYKDTLINLWKKIESVI